MKMKPVTIPQQTNAFGFEDSDRDPYNIYPRSTEYEYYAQIETLNFDEEAENDLMNGEGFVVSPSKSMKKDLKDDNGIFSSKFGQSLGDVNVYMDRYRCKCGKTHSRINDGLICKYCGTRTRFVDDDFQFFGYIKVNEPYAIIQPAFYKKIESFFGRGVSINGQKRMKLENIIDVLDPKDIDGHSMQITDKPADEPFFREGMIYFIEHFDEIMNFYLKLKPGKKEYYDEIMDPKNRKKVFAHNIPVFTTLLRPTDIHDGVMSYEKTNSMYMMINKHATLINKNNTRMQRDPKVKNQELYRLQMQYMELYTEQESILSGKKGDIRCLLGGRYNFSARNVIVQNPNLRIDEVTLPYVTMVVILGERIKNILHRLYNMSFAEAHEILYRAQVEPDKRVEYIITSIIKNYQANGFPGVPVIINRNKVVFPHMGNHVLN